MRSAGSKHGHDNHGGSVGHHDAHDDHGHHGHGDHKTIHVKSLNTKFTLPTEEDIKFQFPEKGRWQQKLFHWISGKWQVDRDDVLCNDKVNKFSAYYWFGNYSL